MFERILGRDPRFGIVAEEGSEGRLLYLEEGGKDVEVSQKRMG
jgi:hypothetical protein